MPAPPPVDQSQRYPVAIRDFLTYANQPPNASKTFSSPGPQGTTIVTDLTLDSASVTRDMNTEIVSLEQTVGQRPFMVPGQKTVGGSIYWLLHNKSPGRVDFRNSVNPMPPPSHNHAHAQQDDLLSDDHPQYVRVDGTRGFNSPVTGHPAPGGNYLITLNQAQGAGLTAAQVQWQIENDLANTSAYPCLGPDGRRWRMAGGFWSGYTDANGVAAVDLRAAGFAGILTFNWMRNPFPGESMLGWYAFQYMEDQLEILGLTNQFAYIQFIEDIRVDKQALVACTWLALGI